MQSKQLMIVIGGLIGETITKSQGQAPCLGDIPLLGWAFKSLSEGKEDTNLYVFITPRVVKNPLEAERIYNEKNSEMKKYMKKGEVTLYDKLNQFGKNKDEQKDKEPTIPQWLMNF